MEAYLALPTLHRVTPRLDSQDPPLRASSRTAWHFQRCGAFAAEQHIAMISSPSSCITESGPRVKLYGTNHGRRVRRLLAEISPFATLRKAFYGRKIVPV